MAGWLAKTRQFFAERSSTEPRWPSIRRVPYNPRTVAGVTINSENALTVATVWACCRYISQTLAQCPWQVFRTTQTGRVPVPTHLVDYLLHYRPNPEWSPFQFKETMVHWATRWGNAYAEIERDAIGRPAALWPIYPDRVVLMRDMVTQRLFYRVDNALGGPVDIDSADMFHLRGFGDGPFGVNVAEYAAESLGLAKAMQLFGASFFGNGMNVSGVIETKKSLTPDGKQKLEADIAIAHKGPRKGKKPLILDADMSWQQTSTDPNDGQFIETNQYMVAEICRWFGVPPHKVQHLLNATFSNIEQQSIEVVVDCLTPWAVRLEEEANFKLFGANRQGFYTKINMRALLRGDFKSQQEGLQIMRNGAAISADEWRAQVDMDPLPPGAGGDKYVIQSQYTTLEKIGEVPAAPADTSDTDERDNPDDPKDPNEPDAANENDEPPDDVKNQLEQLRALLHA